MKKIKSSEITPEALYFSRRQFITGLGALTASAVLLNSCGTPSGTSNSTPATPRPDTLTPESDVLNYNNYYEFDTAKGDIAMLSRDLKITPWTVEVGGLVNNPRTYAIEDLLKKFPSIEHIYRLRCVEAWSMVIPWLGFSLASLLKEADPKSDAKYIRFTALYDPEQMPGQNDLSFDWPYVEGLRLDEAMNELTLLSNGLYGKPLMPQNGAPLRLVIPWKYGFKSIKAIVKIEAVAEQPVSLWMAASPNEYGFYANVNPNVDHPRWSQASERRIGESARRPTLMFNGYADQVASLYAGMDLKKNF